MPGRRVKSLDAAPRPRPFRHTVPVRSPSAPLPLAPSEVAGRQLALRYYDVESRDGTRLRAWTNDADGPTVLLCNGMGTSPYVWPALLRPDCGVRVISWNHRGTGGSARPHDPELVGMDQFVEDALAVLDDAGLDSAPAMGWSIGVNTMYELAVTHPERVSGLFAVAGVPGDTFTTIGAPLLLPPPIRKPIAVGVTRLLGRAGGPLTPLTTRLPIGPKVVGALSHSGFMLPSADPDFTAVAVQQFLTTPVDWYMHLAHASARHLRVSLRHVKVPAAFIAGRWDVLASAKSMRTASHRIPDATYVELPASHFISLEHPDRLHALLRGFLTRVPPA